MSVCNKAAQTVSTMYVTKTQLKVVIDRQWRASGLERNGRGLQAQQEASLFSWVDVSITVLAAILTSHFVHFEVCF